MPPGAFAADTTITIVKDAPGAPALPGGIAPKGSTWAITPHGGAFAAPVEVRIPAPEVTLQPNERLLLAKADPGGEWTILDGAALVDGNLVARVTSFSFFTGVVISYQSPVAEAAPFGVASVSLACGSVDCGFVVDETRPVYTVQTNGGQLPSGCSISELRLHELGVGSAPVPLTGGVVVGDNPRPISRFQAELSCRSEGGPRSILRLDADAQATRATWSGGLPAIGRLIGPGDLVLGQQATVSAWALGASHGAPGSIDEARVEWLRSDDDGHSWRAVATSYRIDATPARVSGRPYWSAWRVDHHFPVTPAEHGARLRPRICQGDAGPAIFTVIT